ncbi:YetF domain-containing protein [Cytobacillus sp. FJAT-54145]|uniref:YetF domain-containing protein n=1 Tax=Cytobacillus spartinae TaxID=3299023 RepID=A0ABW6K746_9BACI
MNHYLMTASELIFGFIILFIVTKSLGKTQFSQITPFDFISALVLGELVGNAVYDHEVKILEILFAVVLWGVLIYFTELITQKYRKTRKVLEGEPNIVIHKGQIKYDTLKSSRLDINQLQSLIRQQGYFSLQDVEYAILETNGMVSVLPKPENDTPKMSDLNLPTQPAHLPITLILDGEVLYDNLKEVGFDENWLKKQLSKQGVTEYKEVLYAEWREDSPLYLNKYEKKSV